MNILIVGAMDEEIQMFLEKIDNYNVKEASNFLFYEASIYDKNVIIVKSGIGRAMSGLLIGVANLLYSIDYVINTGVAGGMNNVLINDVIIGEKMYYGDVDLQNFGYSFGQMASCPAFFHSSKELIDKINYKNIKKGTICTCDSFTSSLTKAQEIEESLNQEILCFDMESTAFAQSCFFLNIPFLAIRSISDIIGSTAQTSNYDNNLVNCATKAAKIVFEIISVL